jgi:predicted MFS family arabinose efflux permease
MAVLMLNTLPAVTGVLARSLGFDAGALGAFASADVFGSTAGTLLAAVLMRRGSPRRAVTVGLGILACANLASSISPTSTVLIALRAAGGLGEGIALGACFAVYARENRERNFAAYALVQTAIAVPVMAAIPAFTGAFGWRAPFICLGVIVLPALALAVRLPAEPMRRDAHAVLVRMPHRLMWLSLTSVFLFNLSWACLWTYLERIGDAAGIDAQSVDRALTVCAVFGFVGSLVVLVLGERVTRPAPLRRQSNLCYAALHSFGRRWQASRSRKTISAITRRPQ